MSILQGILTARIKVDSKIPSPAGDRRGGKKAWFFGLRQGFCPAETTTATAQIFPKILPCRYECKSTFEYPAGWFDDYYDLGSTIVQKQIEEHGEY